MKRVVFAILALALSAPVYANDWSKAADILSKASVYLETAEGSCTGFVINVNARSAVKEGVKKNFVLTAAHCDGDKLFVDHVPATVVYKDSKKDLLVVEVEDLGRPALKLAAKNPKIGDPVASYGYGLGLERAIFRTATISDDALYIPEAGIGGPFIVTDAQFVGGQSGGPVVNLSGEVLLIVQRGGSGVGIGVGAEIIQAAVGRFFGK